MPKPGDVKEQRIDMAVILTNKALNICSDLMTACDQLCIAIEKLVAVSEEKEQSGIDLTVAEVTAALESSDLKHAAGTDFNNVIGSADALKDWLIANGHMGNFQKVRP